MELTSKNIIEVFDQCGTDKGSRVHDYGRLYEDVFKKTGPINTMMEIGVLRGESTLAWSIMHPSASKILSVDINLPPSHPKFTAMNPALVFLEADSRQLETRALVGNGYDLIIDDGDHTPEGIIQTFRVMHTCWTKVYVIEDVTGTEHVARITKAIQEIKQFTVNCYTSKRSDEFSFSAQPHIPAVTRKENFYALMITLDSRD